MLFSFYAWKSNGVAEPYTDTSVLQQKKAYATARKIKKGYCMFILDYPRFLCQSTRALPIPVWPSSEPPCPAVLLFDPTHLAPSPQLERHYLPGLCFAEGWFLPSLPLPRKKSEKVVQSMLAACVGSWEIHRSKKRGSGNDPMPLAGGVWEERTPIPHSLGCSLPLTSYRAMPCPSTKMRQSWE